MKAMTQQHYNAIINKMLEPHGLTIEDIKGVDNWYSINTHTSKQQEAWKQWTINFMRTELRWSKRYSLERFGWIDMNHGLRIKDD